MQMTKEQKKTNAALKKKRLEGNHNRKLHDLVEYYVSINKDIETIIKHVGISRDDVVAIMEDIGKEKARAKSTV